MFSWYCSIFFYHNEDLINEENVSQPKLAAFARMFTKQWTSMLGIGMDALIGLDTTYLNRGVTLTFDLQIPESNQVISGD